MFCYNCCVATLNNHDNQEIDMFKKIIAVLAQVQHNLQTAREAVVMSRTKDPEQISRFFNQRLDAKAVCSK